MGQYHGAFRVVAMVVITGLLLSGAPAMPSPALAMPEPIAAALIGPVAPAGAPVVSTMSAAPALRPRGTPPANFVPAPLRVQAASLRSPLLRPSLTEPPEADPEELISQHARSEASTHDSGPGGRPGLFFALDQSFSHPPQLANDGDFSSAWSSHPSAPLEHWWRVDVGKTYTMTRLLTNWGSPDGQVYDYVVEVSVDGSTYTQVATGSGASGQTTDTFEEPARYLQVTITNNGLGGADDRAWVNEFQVYGILTPPKDQESPCSCENPQGFGGGPFNFRTGYLWTSATDLRLPTGGLPLDWSRTYVSRSITETTGPLGIGWQFPYNSRVITETMPGGEPGLAIVVAPDGNRWRFQETGLSGDLSEPFRAFPGVPHSFVRAYEFDETFSTFTTTFVLTTRDQERWTYSEGGLLIGIQDAQGHQLTLTYTNTSQLERIADTANPDRYLALTYDDDRIAQVSDGVRFVTYTYTDTGDLVRATDVMSRSTDYEYQSHLLTKITNALGQTVEETVYDQYTPAGRVISQTLLDGRHYDVDYQADATTITITGADGREEVQEYRYDESETLIGTSVNDQEQSSSDFEEHFAPGSRSDANGNTTSTVFNQANQPLTVTNALEQSTLIAYDSQNHPITVTDTLGRQTVSAYDGHNNLVRQTTGITTSFPLGFTTLYTYTNDHRLLESSGPDGVVMRQAYDGQGQVISRTVGYGTPLAQTSTYGYDRYGRVVTTTVGYATPLARIDVTRYNHDDTIAESIQNYQDGVFSPDQPDQDIVTSYGYDGLGRRIWVRDLLGRYDVTHYDATGRVDWSARNFVQDGWSGGSMLPAHPPSYSASAPDQNVASFSGIDGLGRTAYVTETGILTGTFDPITLQFSDVTSRTTYTEFDALNRPVTITLNYRPDLSASADRNVQLISRYDLAGNLTWQRDALGRWTRTDYDALNRPITVTVNYENGNPLTVDLANQSWTDGSDTDIVSVTRYRPDGAMDRRIENSVTGVFTATAPITDRITLFQYDAIGRVVTTTLNYDPPTLGSRTDTNRASVTAYDPTIGRVIDQRDPLGRWISQQYDLLGRVATTVQNCTGGSAPMSCGSPSSDANVASHTGYDALGRTAILTDALGIARRTVYDNLGRSVSSIQNWVAGGPTTAITNVTSLMQYDALGRTLVMTDALGYATHSSYNGLSQTSIVTDTIGRVTRMGYDGQGALRWTLRPDGQVTVVQVDGLGRSVTTIVNYDDGAVGGSEPSDQDLISRTVYDIGGRRVQAIDPAGRATAFAYDQQDRLVAVTENAVSGGCVEAPCNVVTQYQYDRAGNRIAIIDARGNLRTFEYDAANQQIAADDAVHPPTSWEYDAGGRMTVQHDPRGITDTLTFAYDGLDRRIQTSASSLVTITAQYDVLGRRVSLDDATGTTSFDYDPLSRITQVDAPNTGVVGYSYDARGQRTGLAYPGSTTLDYSYWPDGQLRVVTDTTTLASSSYDALGRLDTLTRANGATTSYSYDDADRLLLSSTVVSGTTVAAFEYGVDRLGMRTVVTETLGISNTALVKDIRTTGLGNSNPSAGVTIGDTYFFSADDGVHGIELWKSDGTTTGTTLVKDIRSGSTGSNPTNLTVVNGTLFFTANDGTSGTELWKSDGSSAGTVLVKDIRSGILSGLLLGTLAAVHDTLFLTANDGTNGQELWKSDGTSVGTVLVKDIQTGASGSSPTNLTALGTTLFFTASDSTNGSELWSSDGTTGGTVLVKDIQAGASGSSPSNLTTLGATLFFAADDGTNGSELWASDGTSIGTALVKDIEGGASGSSPQLLATAGDTLFFSAFTSAAGQELWTSDGTTGGTVLVKDIQTGSPSTSPTGLTAVDGNLFFRASDGTTGQELWKSDGTLGGTVLVKDIQAGSSSANLLNLTAANGRLFFSADDGTTGQELWVSDGTSVGTLLVADIQSGGSGANPTNLRGSAGRLFFSANDGTHGQELWLHTPGASRVITYAYDGLQRLSGATESPGTTYAYSYDEVGNRTGVWLNGTRVISQTHDDADQVVGWSYDAAGNLLNDGTASYNYDALNRLIQQDSTTNVYNGDGVLVQSGVTTYTQDLASPLSQVLQTTQSLTTTEYLYGQQRLAADDGSDRTWYVSDALGSVRQTLDDSGAVLGTVNYDPWGQVESGSVPTFGFTGELQDASGMVYLRARWYNPTNGTFTAKDPFEGMVERPQTLTPYPYVENNPVNMVDPSGKLGIFVMGFYGPSSNEGAAGSTMGQMAIEFSKHINGPTIISDPIGGRFIGGNRHNDVLQLMTDAICAAAEKHEPIILVGYSRGAATVHAVASILEKEKPDINIDLVVSFGIIPEFPLFTTIDDGGEVDYSVRPGNVKKYLNYVSTLGSLAATRPEERILPPFEREVLGADNYSRRVIEHTSHGTLTNREITPTCWYRTDQDDPKKCQLIDGVYTRIDKPSPIQNRVWPETEQAIMATRR